MIFTGRVADQASLRSIVKVKQAAFKGVLDSRLGECLGLGFHGLPPLKQPTNLNFHPVTFLHQDRLELKATNISLKWALNSPFQGNQQWIGVFFACWFCKTHTTRRSPSHFLPHATSTNSRQSYGSSSAPSAGTSRRRSVDSSEKCRRKLPPPNPTPPPPRGPQLGFDFLFFGRMFGWALVALRLLLTCCLALCGFTWALAYLWERRFVCQGLGCPLTWQHSLRDGPCWHQGEGWLPQTLDLCLSGCHILRYSVVQTPNFRNLCPYVIHFDHRK